MKTYLIAGTSAAGMGAVTKLRQLDKDARIICVSDEKEFPYNKCFLVDYLSHEKSLEQVYTKPQDFFEKNNIELKLGTRVTQIDRKNKQITCQDGSIIEYTKLLLGLGGSLVIPPIEGIKDIQGSFPFYNLYDTQNIKTWVERPETKNIVIIGAGLSGLECADALTGYNAKLMLVDRNSQVLGRQVDKAGAQFIQDKAKEFNTHFYFNTSITKIHSQDGVVKQVELSDGTLLDADMVICALGARPNSDLAQAAGLEIEQGAVATNQWLQTSDPDIYAAGDNALVLNKLTGEKMRNCTWPDALVQGMRAGTNMVEHTKPYAGVTLITASCFFDLSFHVAGAVLEDDPDMKIKQTSDYYQKIKLDQGVVKGFILIGHTQHLSHLKRSLLTSTPLEKDSI
jgi:NAD(P)H-nitrite reductase large subunit